MSTTRIKQFKTDYVNRGGKIVAIDKVEVCAIGQAERATKWFNISEFSRLRPVVDHSNDIAAMMMHDLWSQIEPAYKAWKSGQEVPEDGIPLGAWPGVTQEQAAILRSVGFRTVEELAEANDSAINRIQLPGARTLVENAQRYLKAQDKNRVALELEQKDREIAELKAQMEELFALVKAGEDKPRRGRPPKAVADDTTEAVA